MSLERRQKKNCETAMADNDTGFNVTVAWEEPKEDTNLLIIS